MERLIVGRGFAPEIVEKAGQALREGRRRPLLSSAKKWKIISVGYRHRLLLRGNGTAELMTHETLNRYLSTRSSICK